MKKTPFSQNVERAVIQTKKLRFCNNQQSNKLQYEKKKIYGTNIRNLCTLSQGDNLNVSIVETHCFFSSETSF